MSTSNGLNDLNQFASTVTLMFHKSSRVRIIRFSSKPSIDIMHYVHNNSRF